MNVAAPAAPARRGPLAGTVRVFLGEAMALPTGLLTAAFLTRALGPEGYGLFTLAATLVAWVAWGVASVFARTAVKLVADADDWRPVAAAVVRSSLALGIAAGAALALLAGPIARLLGEPALVGYLRLFAVEVPLFALANAHRNVLVGVGEFTARALAAAARWTVRLALVLLFVGLGLSVRGAILGSVGATLAELAVCRLRVRPRILGRSGIPGRALWDYAAPLFLSALSLRVFDRLDLIAYKALGGTAEGAGLYGAAQNLALVPGILAMSLSPPLLAALTRALRDGDSVGARAGARDAYRAVLLLLPFAALAAGMAGEIVPFVFGAPFAQAAPLFAALIFAATALLAVSAGTAMLVAAGRPGLSLALTGPLPALALGGHLLAIPRLGAQGAALVTTALAVAGAAAVALAVRRELGAAPPAATAARAVALCAALGSAAALWPAGGALVVPKAAALALAVPLGFLALGELRAPERARARALLGRRPAAG